MALTTLDWALLGLTLAVPIAVGIAYGRRSGRDLSQFFLSGRDLPWWLAGTSMVATTFAADTPLAVTGIVASSGVAGNWLWWNAALGSVLTVVFFARLWRRAGILTDVEFVELQACGPRCRTRRSDSGLPSARRTARSWAVGYVLVMRDHLPSGWRGVLVGAFFAAYMSTVSTQLNWGTSYLVNDGYKRFLRPDAGEPPPASLAPHVRRWAAGCAAVYLTLAATHGLLFGSAARAGLLFACGIGLAAWLLASLARDAPARAARVG